METNALTSLTTNLFRRQKSTLRLLFPRKHVDSIVWTINSPRLEESLQKLKEKKFPEFDNYVEAIKKHRTVLFEDKSIPIPNVFKHPTSLIRYYHFLLKIVDVEKNCRKEKPQDKYLGKIRSFSILPYHGYSRFSLTIENAVFVMLMKRIKY